METNHDEKIIPVAGPQAMVGSDELIKPGIFFTLGGRYTGLYTGDLFYGISDQKFRITGIPSDVLGPMHCLRPNIDPKQHFTIDLCISQILDYNANWMKDRCSLNFRKALCAGQFLAWMEETHPGKFGTLAAQENWDVAPGILAWVK